MWENRLGLFAILFLIISLITVPFSASPAFAKHANDEDFSNDPEYEGKTPLRVYTIFASQTLFGCGDYDHEKLNFFKSLTEQTLLKYDFLPIRSNAHECVKVSGDVSVDSEYYGLTLSEAFQKAENWHPNSTILIFDDKLSHQYYIDTYNPDEGTVWLGHITYSKKIIVSSSNLGEIEEQKGAWTLSHELAHFALNYYYPNDPNIYSGYVHAVDKIYDDCVINQFRDDICSDTYTTVKRYTGNFKVLRPYEPPEPKPVCGTGTVLKNGVCIISKQPVYPELIGKYPTELTLFPSTTTPTEGETVYFQGIFRYFCNDGSCVFGTSPGEKVTIQSTNTFEFPNGEIGRIFLGKGFVASDGTFKIPWTADKHFLRYSDGKSYWFTEAVYEGSAKFLSTSVEGQDIIVFDKPALSEPKPKFESELPITPTPSIPEQTTAFRDTFLTLEVKVGSRAKIIEFNPILKYSSGKEIVTNNVKLKVDDTEYQVFANKWSEVMVDSLGQHKLTASYEGYSTRGGSIVYGFSSDTKTIFLKTQPISEEDEIQALRNDFVKIIKDIESGVEVSEKSLTGLTFQKKEAQEKINLAWDYLKESKIRTDVFYKKYLKEVDSSIANNEHYQVQPIIDSAKNSADIAGDNLKKISALIEEAKELEKQKFCFLWWCW